MNIFTFSLFLLQHPYVEPPDYYDNSNFCSTCDTLEFYIITFACLLLVVIMTQIKKIDKERHEIQMKKMGDQKCKLEKDRAERLQAEKKTRGAQTKEEEKNH